jgi:cytochrome P450
LLSCNLHIEDIIHVEITNTLTSKVQVHNKDERDDPSTLITYEELKEMHYLHVVVTKFLRLYPSVPFDAKMAIKDDVLLDGTQILKMSYVGHHPYAMRRMEQLWGVDCLEFKPKRWLKDGVFVLENPYNFFVFRPGPCVCLGKDFEMLQMKLVAARLLTHFTFFVVENFKPMYAINMTTQLKNGLPMKIHPRVQK